MRIRRGRRVPQEFGLPPRVNLTRWGPTALRILRRDVRVRGNWKTGNALPPIWSMKVSSTRFWRGGEAGALAGAEMVMV